MSSKSGARIVEGRVESKVEVEYVRAQARAAAQYGRWSELEGLLEGGELSVNDLDDEGCTLLQWSSINNRTAVVASLLERGADPNASGGILKETALQWAARQGHVEPCVLLREAGCDPSHRGVEGGNAVHLACRYGKHVVVAYLVARDEAEDRVGLLDQADDRGRSPLMICVEWYWHEARGGLDTLRVLVALGCSVNLAERESGLTALHLAAERNLDRGALETLVDAGASLEAEDGEGRTAETVALSHGHVHAAGTLRALRMARAGPCGLGRRGGTADGGSSVVDGCFRPRSTCFAKAHKRLRTTPNDGADDDDDDDDIEEARKGLLATPCPDGSSSHNNHHHHNGNDNGYTAAASEKKKKKRKHDEATSSLTAAAVAESASAAAAAEAGLVSASATGAAGDQSSSPPSSSSASSSPTTRRDATSTPSRKGAGPSSSSSSSSRFSRCAAVYGFGSPWIAVLAPIALCARAGWPLTLVVAPFAGMALVAASPRGAGRYTMCGFAAASIGVIVASFFAAGAHRASPLPAVALYVALVSCLVANFVLAIVSDPGVIDLKRRDKILKIVDLARSKRLVTANLCPTCLVDKPPRSKHDPTLGKCVKRFDHFCPYIANAVGQNNYLYFYLFLVFVVLAISTHVALIVPHITLIGTGPDDECPPVAAGGRGDRPRFRAAAAAAEDPLSSSSSTRRTICLLDPAQPLLLVGTALAVIHLAWVSTLCCVPQPTSS